MERPERKMFRSTLFNGVSIPESKNSNDLSNLERFLQEEKQKNSGAQPWNKLDKTSKTACLIAFADSYKKEKGLNDAEHEKMVQFLRDCLDRKKLLRVKEVVFDKTNGVIKDIPALSHNRSNNHFTLRNLEKRVSTLKSLGPKKTIAKDTAEAAEAEDDENDLEL